MCITQPLTFIPSYGVHLLFDSKSKWTPYDGMKVKGWVTHTILRGNCVMQDDEILSKPLGQMVKFKETI